MDRATGGTGGDITLLSCIQATAESNLLTPFQSLRNP